MGYKIYIEQNGERRYVGIIDNKKETGAEFQYDAAYCNSGKAISVSLPLQEEPFDTRTTKCFFDGLLPEGFTRRSVARWMHVDEDEYLKILAGLGKECLGALQIIDEKEQVATETGYRRLTLDEVKALAAEGATKSTELVVGSHLSLTGASGKTGLYYNPRNQSWYQPIGTAASTHIVKQSHVRLQNIVENEQLMLRTAEELGLNTVSSQIVRVGENNDSGIMLATKRYDRDLENGKYKISGLVCPLRLHQEDFAQALRITSAEKYEPEGERYLQRIFSLVRNVCSEPLKDQIQLLDILILDFLIGNTDNHIKNMALIYSCDLCQCHLAPAYDLVSTMLYKESTSEMSISVAGERDWKKISRKTFIDAASEIGISSKVIAGEYDRLAHQLPEALEKASSALEREGYQNCRRMKEEVLSMNRMHKCLEMKS